MISPTIRTKHMFAVTRCRIALTGWIGIALLLAGSPARGQEPTPQVEPTMQVEPARDREFGWGQERGWSVGLQFLSDHIGAEDPSPTSPSDAVFVEEAGGGVLLHGGYAFTPSFALRLSVAGARHETTRDGVEIYHGSVALEAHFRFLHGQRAQPFLFGGLGGSTLEFNSDTLDSKTRGGLAVVGAGVMYHLTRHLSLDFSGRLDLINWDTVEVTATLPGGQAIRLEDPVDESGTAAKLLVGLAWNF